MNQTAKDRIVELKKLIVCHNDLYFQQNKPEISDQEFDKLCNELHVWYKLAPELVEPITVGERPTGALQAAKHRYQMLSIENVYSEDALRSFLTAAQSSLPKDRLQVCLEYKMDGAAVSVEYSRGRLVQAISRGNGLIGDDITHNAKTFHGLPAQISQETSVLIRGEAYMLFSDLVELNKSRLASGQPLLKNVRNTASGAIRLQDAEECRSRNICFVAHGLAEWIRTAGAPIPGTYSETMRLLALEGLDTIPNRRIVRGVEEAIQAANELVADIPKLPFAVDGVVVKIDYFEQQADMGVTSNAPRWAMAYKITKYEAVTRVNNIVWQVGKTGAITPVAELEPVDIDGSTISRSTLHNFQEIQRKDIRVGDYVTVEKAGAVIPYISRVELDRRSALSVGTPAPEHCPACGSKAETTDGYVAIKCENPGCGGKLVQQLLHFTSRDAMDIEGLGVVLAEQLVQAALVTSVLDLYTLTADSLGSLERVGSKTTKTLLANIQNSKQRGLAAFLYSLAIPMVGQRASTSIANRFGSLDAILAKFNSVGAGTKVDLGLGIAVGSNFEEFIRSDFGKQLLQRTRQLGIYTEVPADEKVDTAGVFAGKTVVVTGSMDSMDRSDIEKLIVKHGGKAGSSVSKNTNMLVAGPGAGSKLTKATQLGVKVVTEAEFLTMLV